MLSETKAGESKLSAVAIIKTENISIKRMYLVLNVSCLSCVTIYEQGQQPGLSELGLECQCFLKLSHNESQGLQLSSLPIADVRLGIHSALDNSPSHASCCPSLIATLTQPCLFALPRDNTDSWASPLLFPPN